MKFVCFLTFYKANFRSLNMVTNLFSTGKIYLIKQPINGNSGVPSLYARLLNGSFGIEITDDEYYAIFSNSSRKLLIIVYKNEAGVGVFKWRLFSGKFKILIDGNQNEPSKITRSQLKRLIMDGTIEGEWQSNYQKEQFLKNNNKI